MSGRQQKILLERIRTNWNQKTGPLDHLDNVQGFCLIALMDQKTGLEHWTTSIMFKVFA
jgi:hypothetical protein